MSEIITFRAIIHAPAGGQTPAPRCAVTLLIDGIFHGVLKMRENYARALVELVNGQP